MLDVCGSVVQSRTAGTELEPHLKHLVIRLIVLVKHMSRVLTLGSSEY